MWVGIPMHLSYTCLSQINEEEETFRLYLRSCQVCAVLVKGEGEKAPCTLLSYSTSWSTGTYDEQPQCVLALIHLGRCRRKERCRIGGLGNRAKKNRETN